MTGNRYGHLLRPDIGFFATIRLGKYPGKYRDKYLCLFVRLTIIIPRLKRSNWPLQIGPPSDSL